MRPPSGDHDGWANPPGPLVSWRNPEPSGLTTKIWPVFAGPTRLELNAISLPSGDQAGHPSKAALFDQFHRFIFSVSCIRSNRGYGRSGFRHDSSKRHSFTRVSIAIQFTSQVLPPSIRVS